VTVPDQPAIDRIPLAHSVHYAVRGAPEVPNQYGPGVLRPSEITITYKSSTDSQLGRIHAYVAGRIWVDGKETPLLPGGLYGQHYFDGLNGWPEWLAEEARLHDPDAAPAVQAPAADRAALRDRIAAAIIESDGVPSFEFAARLHRQAAFREADAVLAVLPAPTDRATVLREAADRLEERNPDRSADFSDGVDWALDELRRMAAEAQQDGPQR
jgi:hypothetical protein